MTLSDGTTSVNFLNTLTNKEDEEFGEYPVEGDDTVSFPSAGLTGADWAEREWTKTTDGKPSDTTKGGFKVANSAKEYDGKKYSKYFVAFDNARLASTGLTYPNKLAESEYPKVGDEIEPPVWGAVKVQPKYNGKLHVIETTDDAAKPFYVVSVDEGKEADGGTLESITLSAVITEVKVDVVKGKT